MVAHTFPNRILPHEGKIWQRDCTLFVREVGRGRPIVILHGGPDLDHTYLLPELDQLAQDFQLIYYDQRGRGRSHEFDRAEAVTLRTEIDDMEAVRQFFGVKAMIVLGHSWGSVLAMEYAIHYPGCVSGLVLMNPAPASRTDYLFYRQERRKREPEVMERLDWLAETPLYRTGDAVAEAEYYRVHYGSTIRSMALLDDLLKRLRRHFTTEGILIARQIESRLMDETWRVNGFDLLPEMQKVASPTLVIHGDHDLVPVECAAHIAEAIPGARLEVLKGCGHFAYIENPEAVVELVEAWAKKELS